jgi:hypothetical protein
MFLAEGGSGRFLEDPNLDLADITVQPLVKNLA